MMQIVLIKGVNIVATNKLAAYYGTLYSPRNVAMHMKKDNSYFEKTMNYSVNG